MEFHTYTTMYQVLSKAGVKYDSPEEYYEKAASFALASGRSATVVNQLEAERAWGVARKPYYAVYPSITPMLLKLRLDLDSSLIKLPMSVLCVRFPVNSKHLTFEHDGKEYQVRTILMSQALIVDSPGITLWIDYGEREAFRDPFYKQRHEFPVLTYRNFRCKPGHMVEDDLSEPPNEEDSLVGVKFPSEIDKACVKLCCSLCLMQSDPEIICPDVLANDAKKYEQTRDQKFVDKAHRRGKVGWLIGSKLEVIPHVRRPHPALVWTEKGRNVPKIVMRKGSIVHRKAVEKLPSGFETDPTL